MARSAPEKAVDKAERRIERWMQPEDWKGVADFDAPAYGRMAEQLIAAMSAVGPSDITAGVAALAKVMALVGHGALTHADEATVREFGHDLGRKIAVEILSLRMALKIAPREN